MRDINTFLALREDFSVVTIEPDGDALQIDLTPYATRFPSCGGCHKPCSTIHEYCKRTVRDLPILGRKVSLDQPQSQIRADAVDAQHVCQDLHQARWEQVPAHDILLASPCCQDHAKARGKNRATLSTMLRARRPGRRYRPLSSTGRRRQ